MDDNVAVQLGGVCCDGSHHGEREREKRGGAGKEEMKRWRREEEEVEEKKDRRWKKREDAGVSLQSDTKTTPEKNSSWNYEWRTQNRTTTTITGERERTE